MPRGSYQEKLNFSVNFYTILQVLYYEVMKTLACHDNRLWVDYHAHENTEEEIMKNAVYYTCKIYAIKLEDILQK
jgi:hypothetical protein